ncbi:MAG: hypothetical protein HY928_03860 [Elusimicrobia bacterium]|nr:hypothetical protein [Elusimicrobiota bacterium]
MLRTRAFVSAAGLLALWASGASAAGLDVTAEHRMRALSYQGVRMAGGSKEGSSFLSQSTRLGFVFKNIPLGERRGETQTMDIAVKLRAVGVMGSTTAFSAPFDKAAAAYPNATYIPFLENAALQTHNLGGIPWDVTFGRQSFTQGSGLLLDDNGAGLSGIAAKGRLPWWGMSAEGFVFQAAHPMSGPGALDVLGATLELPSEGTWRLNQLFERDKRDQTVAAAGCRSAVAPAVTAGCVTASKATRWFSSLSYQLRYGPLVFDGEAALQRGAATPTGPGAPGNHITYNGNAQVVKAKWRQTFYRSKTTGKKVEGIARMSFARGSGDDGGTPSTDEAFFPSHGKRFDGLEREGFGDLFAATPYDAFGGQSTATANGLQRGSSGLVIIGLGATPPAWRDIVLDFDYYLVQAERGGASRGLGTEMDIRLRHDIRDRLTIRLSAAFFKGGAALDPGKPSARRYMLEASGRF